MKDDRIRYVGAERQALFDFHVMAAVITNANLPAVDMAVRIIRALSDLARLPKPPGGFAFIDDHSA